jgi:cobaltochelatase CobN
VDGGGEYLQAKRRSQAVIISHLTPLLAAAGSNPDYAKIRESLEHLRQLKDGDPALEAQYSAEILAEAKRLRLFEKLGLRPAEVLSPETVAKIEEYFDDQEAESIPLGLDTIGARPPEAAIRDALRQFLQSSFSGDEAAQARPHIAQWADDLIANRAPTEAPDLLAKVRKDAETWLESLYQSPARELEGLLAVLAGRGLPTGVAGDPLRTPDALPTGRNMHDQDPRNFPTKAAWEVGKRMADALMADQLKKKGRPLEKASFVLWYGESNRHQGIAEAQALFLLGTEPVWNGRGQVEDVKLIPAAQLGRPRVDVVLTMSGLYRDGMPEKLHLLDRAVKLAAAAEEDNAIRRNAALIEQRLRQQGVDADVARKAGLARLFGPAPQSSGPGLARMMESSQDDNSQGKVAEQYLANMNYAYSEGLWEQKVQGNLAAQLFNNQVVIHSRSTNLYGVVDNDETYQFAGGLNAATAVSSGQAPDLLVSNVRSPGRERFEDMKKFITRELDSRVWNPKWIQAMKDSGYAGAQEIAKEAEHLYGLRATAPAQIDSSVWQQMFDVYVKDKNKLGLKEFFDTQNPYAQQMLTARLLELDRQGVYHFSEGDRRSLLRTFIESVNSHGVSCYANACANRNLRSYILNHSRESAAVAPSQLQKWLKTVRKAAGESAMVRQSPPIGKPANIRMLPSLLSKVRVVSREEFERKFRPAQWDGNWAYWFTSILFGGLYALIARRRRFWSFDPAVFHDRINGAGDRHGS